MPPRPRVGLLTYGLDRPISGVSRVALELGRALLARDDCEVVFLTPYQRGPFANEPGVRRVYLPGCRLLPGLMLLGGPLIALAAQALALDVVHDPIGVSPFTLGRWAGRFARLVTIHDAIAFEYPQGYPWLNNLLHRVYVPATLGNVDAVATDSRHAQQALSRFLGLAPDRVPVVPLGADGRPAPSSAAEIAAVRARYRLDKPYVLYVGAFKRHKNVRGLLAAFAAARDRLPGFKLALVGPSQWAFPELEAEIDRLGLRDDLAVLGYVPDDDLLPLYAGAAVYALPSFHEGFGIPVLEAMACGTPVVSSTASSLPEVAGDAALLVDPHDSSAIAEALVRLATDLVLAEELRRRGRERVEQFTWAKTAERYVELYRTLTTDNARR
jgi:glycosyltransferase involved in cell wall biosynthesis